MKKWGSGTFRAVTGIIMLAFGASAHTAEEFSLPLPLPELPPPGATLQRGGLPSGGFGTAPQFDPSQLVFDIPPVFQRPLGVEEGGRVFVRDFVVTGVLDDAEAGVLRSEIDERVRRRFQDLNQLLARLRVERQNQDDVGSDGFTTEEREAIIAFVAGAVRDLSPERQTAAYRAFVDQLRLQRLERTQGLTIGQIQLIADEITRYYREKGFFLARAVIPAQEVVDGIVVIRVLEGRLGGVDAQGNRRYSSKRVAAPFKPHMGKLVTVERIEDALLTLQDYPGLNAVGVFQPGSDVGEADVLVNVSGENRFSFLLRGDNHGTRFTGENRLLGEATWNSPTGYGDLLRLTALQTYEPDNSLFGAIKYEVPFANPRRRFGVEYTRNTFDVANLSSVSSGNEVGGVSEIATVNYKQNFVRTRARKLGGELSLSRKSAETQEFGSPINLDELAVLGVEMNYENINASAATISSAFVRLDGGLDGALGVASISELRQETELPPSRVGEDSNGERLPAGSDFLKLGFGYSWLKSLTVNQTLLFRFHGQYTDDLLPSLEQFTIGGASSVRGLPSAHYLVDSGAFVSLEWGVRAPGFSQKRAFGNRNWGDVLRFTAFYDHAYGRYVDEAVLVGDDERAVRAGSVGVGFEFGLPGKFRLNAQWAKLLSGPEVDADNVEDPRAVLRDEQVWVDITFEF